MHQILCSTGALIGRPNGRDFHLLRDCAEKLRCDGFEFMMYDTWYDQAEELSQFLLSLSLSIPVMHCEKRIGEALSQEEEDVREAAFQRFEVNCQLASLLGARKMVMHLWDGLASDQRVENNFAAYERLRNAARRHGLSLTIENVVCSAADPLSHWRRILSLDEDALFTYDTKMAAFHGQAEAMYLPENRPLWEHIVHLHLNDYAGGYKDWTRLKTLHIGQGSVDFDRLFAFLREIGYAGDYTVEATSFLPDGVIHWDDLNRTFARIRAYL